MASTSKSTKSASKKRPAPTPLKVVAPKKPKTSKKSAPTPVESDASPESEKEEWGGVTEGAVQKESGDKDHSEAEDGGYLHGFSSDDDSSDEEGFDPAEFDVAKLPTVAKDDASVKRKLEKAKKRPTEERGVLYLGRLPHGFYEDQLKAYFSQFGEVTRLRISRNKRTGKSKHYGFIEFDSLRVAEIVAETMDNYLLMGHILRCKLMPKDEVHPELWIGANRKWRKVPRQRVVRNEHNKERTEEQQRKAESRLLKRQNERKHKLEEAGISYNFESVAYQRKKAK